MNVATHPLLERLAANYVLGLMQPGARRRLEAAMHESAAVRAAIDAWSSRLHLLSRVEFELDPSPQVFSRVERRIEQSTPAPASDARTAVVARGARWWRWLRPAAGFALGVLLTTAVVVLQTPEYETLTTPPAVPVGQRETLHVVFAPGTPIEQGNAALRAIGASIVDGPTDRGVLTVAIPPGQPVQSALATLRTQPGVRFAEPASAPAGGTPR